MTTWTIGAAASAVAVTAALLPPTALADPAADPATVAPLTPLTGRMIFLDPGHQGTGHDENLARQVDDGRGGTKDCQTTGMTTLGGTPEHTVTWDVSQLVKAGLEKLGATVELSRQDDTGWGGCVDERARAANASGADLAVSIHADSTVAGEDDNRNGFHLIVPTLPIPDARVDEVQSGPGLAASTAIRDAYLAGGFTAANYAGVVDGLQSRADIAGPALTTVPLAFVEMGNGSNPADAAVLDSADGRLKHAVAIIVGAVDFLMGTDGAGAPATAEAAAPATAIDPGTVDDSAVAAPQAPASPTTTAPTTSTPGTDERPAAAEPEALLAQGLTALQTLLSTLGPDGMRDLATAENLGIFADLIATLLDELG
ncbi:N-acetylmuramoyl-L-alanine amidase [Rhodococcus sp. NPDC054953]